MKIQAWQFFHHDWLEAAVSAAEASVIFVVFEDLQRDPRSELRRMASFMTAETGPGSEARLECVMRHREGSAHRGEVAQGKVVRGL